MSAARLITASAAALCAAALAAPRALSAEVEHDNVVIVLDASGSMGNNMRGTHVQKMKAAKDALSKVLGKIPPSTYVALLVFSGKNLSNDLVYPLGPRNEARLARAIAAPQPGGNTPLGRYIKKGADLLLAQRAKQMGYGTYRLLIVTDGEAQDRHLVDRYTPEAIARGITVDVIGVDMKTTHTLATKVHSYRRADNPESLHKALAEVFAEVSGSGKDATVSEDFDLIAALPVESAQAMIRALSTSGNHPLGTRPGTAAVRRPVRRTVPATAPATPPVPVQPAPTGTATQSKGISKGTVITAGLVVLLIVLPLVLRKKKRGNA